MTTLVARPLVRLWSNPIDQPHGVSRESSDLDNILADVEQHLIRNTFIGSEVADSINELLDVFRDCVESNWDEYGARGVSSEAVLEAQSFIRQIPYEAAMPSIIPEPDGDIGFEWSDEGTTTFTVSLGGKSEATFAGLLGGGNRIYGTAQFVGSIPKNIRQILVQHFPRSSPKTRSAK